jgi:drug/metabolite transporter (DMT)-like permease
MAEAALLQPIRFTRILISMVLSYIILSERPASAQVIGAVMIIAANAFSIWYSRKYQSKKYVK